MKLSSEVLKKMIAEEMKNMQELDVPAPTAMDSAPPQGDTAGASDVAGLRKALQ